MSEHAMNAYRFAVTLKGVTYSVRPWWSRYETNHHLALVLYLDPPNPEDPSPLCKASVNLDEPIGPDQMFVKDYNETEGLLLSLELAGIVRDTGRYMTNDWVTIPLVDVLVPHPMPDGI